MSISVGETRQLGAVGAGLDGNGQQLTGGLGWNSSNDRVATVTPNGLVTGIAAGSATITAHHADSGKTGRASVTVMADTSITVTEIPYDDGVSRADAVGTGTKRYKVTGVAPAHPYAMSLTDLSGDVDLVVYSDAAFQRPACESLTAGTADERCVTAGSASGELHLAVDGQYSGSGATFTLVVTQAFPVTQLVHPGDFPHSGFVGTDTSHYRVSGLFPGASYTVSLTGLTADADLIVYSDGAFQQRQCESLTGQTADEQCDVAASASGEIYLGVDGQYSAAGAAFELNLTAFAVTHLPYPASFPRDDQVGADAEYYRVTGLTPGTYVTVTLADLTADADLTVYSDASFDEPLCAPQLGGTETERCVLTATAAGELYVGVSLYAGSSGAFTLDVASLPQLEYGSESLPHPGVVAEGATQRHAVTGLVPGALYVVSLSSPDGDADLTVYLDSDFRLWACESLTPGVEDEQCLATANGYGELFVETTWESDSAGAGYVLDVTTLTRLAHGTANLPHSGSVSAGAKRYYAVTGLTAELPYTVSMTSLSDDVDLVVYSDSGFQLWSCSSRNDGQVGEQCVVGANAWGELYVVADGQGGAHPATFILDVQP